MDKAMNCLTLCFTISFRQYRIGDDLKFREEFALPIGKDPVMVSRLTSSRMVRE
jgi:hypothetical protein